MRTGRKYIAVLGHYAIDRSERDYGVVFQDSALGSMMHRYRVCGSRGEAKRMIRRFCLHHDTGDWKILDVTGIKKDWVRRNAEWAKEHSCSRS
jgi:hypothetical protein